MRAILFIFSFVCASTLLAQTNWEYDITDKSHSILFPVEVTTTTFEQGDFMGVFYEENNELICAGYSEYTEENMVLTAFGASFSFSGFTDGQLFHFKHWSALTNSEEVFYVTYNTLDFPNTTNFVYNGMSGISSIIQTLIDGCTDTSAINYNEFANVEDNSCISVLQNHYNLSLDSISDLYTLYTQELETLSDSTSTVISQLESVLIVQEDSISDLHILYTQELGSLTDSTSTVIYDLESALIILDDSIAGQSDILLNLGNQIYLNNDSLSILNLLLEDINEELSLKSDTIAFLNEPILINLMVGWNMIGYTRNTEMDFENGFLTIVNEISVVKDNNGDVYIPLYNYKGIENLIPGQGYQIHMITEQIFSFPTP